jgi:hypothetical protein
MTFTVEYLLYGRRVARSPLLRTDLDDTVFVARDGMERHRADSARILDCAGVEVTIVPR